MFPAALRHFVLGAALLAASSLRAADAAARAAPTRPGTATPPPTSATAPAPGPASTSRSASSVPLKKIGNADYVNLTDAATRLGLKFSWVKRGRIALLSGPGARAEIEADSRETTINGLRVF